MRLVKLNIIFLILLTSTVLAQFGQNKVHYKEFDWFFIQSKHFDIYFSEAGKVNAEFAAAACESALADIEMRLEYKINNRISIIVYNSHNDFQETNTTDSYLGQGTGGFTEPFKNRVVFPFEGSYKKFRHVIHHELVHAVMRDMLYGGTIQNIIAKGISLQLPHWYHEGMAEYLSSGWETNSDQFIRNAVINEFLPDIKQLSGYFGYRGGQSVFKYIADKYGEQKIGELLIRIKDSGNLEMGLKSTIGLSLEELNERWKKDLKVDYWPEIATRDEPDDFSRRLTDSEKIGGFYNTSPSISPLGDKMVFISDRDIYLDVYVRSINDKEKINRIVSSGKAFDFEELNVLHPTLTWSPDNNRIALSLKQLGYDVISIINVETEDHFELPFKFDGIETVSWSPDGNKIAFVGHDGTQSDIYTYDFNSDELLNLTDDIFTDNDPVWGPNSDRIFFSSDRGEYLNKSMIPSDFNLFEFNYKQLDLYKLNLNSNVITRLTDWELSDERSAVVSPNEDEILFVSDKNGIFNIYKKKIVFSRGDTVNLVSDLNAVPITNSLNPVEQLSLSKDGKKLIFTSLYKKGYNIFLINNPFDMDLEFDELVPTKFMAELKLQKDGIITDNNLLANSNVDSLTNTLSADEQTQNDEDESKGFVFSGELVSEDGNPNDTTETDYSNYIFGSKEIITENSEEVIARENLFSEKLDDSGNYLVNKYKINFSPDLIYANAGWSTLYGLLGTTVLSFSDVLGNHRLIGVTGFQIDLKNSDYGLSYYYLAKKINYGVEGFHTARFVYLNRGLGSNLFRFRNFGLVVSASIPLNRFYRFDASVATINVSSENLDNINEPMEKELYALPSISLVHDNTMWGYYSPIQGTRYKITTFGNLGFSDAKLSFYSVTWDFRKYIRFLYDNSFVFRFSGGYSGGNNPQRFMLGGIDNWINRTFATGTIPINSASDFAFLSPAMPLRGYNYAEQIGTKYMLLNVELRMPIIRLLLAGPIIPLFFQNIIGSAFLDVGAAWNENEDLRFFKKDFSGKTVTDRLLVGTGFGVRSFVLFFLLRLDVAWAYNGNSFSTPKYYFSLGYDF